MESILVGVKFNTNNTEYVFRCFDAVKIGDVVVVDTRYGFSIGTVTAIELKTSIKSNDIKEVVEVVNTTAFYERKAKAERLKELKNTIDNKVKELQEISVYEMIAKENPELQELISEYKNLL